MKVRLTVPTLLVILSVAVATTWAAETVVDIHAVTPQGSGEKIGTMAVSETVYGTLFTPALSGLTPGLHGFHVHVTGNCGASEKDGHMVAGMAAGGHYDPAQTNSHKGPYGDGHLGDLPALYADPAGMAMLPVLAPRIHLSDLKGRALMIHEGGDNYSDTPSPLGGGGARAACGVVE